MNNPIKNFTKKEWILWIASLLIVIVSNLFSTDFDLLTLMAALIGVTSLIFAAKGNVWAQILMIMFSILYGIISYRFRYWGEMITYLGMALPMAIWSTLTWIRGQWHRTHCTVDAGLSGESGIYSRCGELHHFLF